MYDVILVPDFNGGFFYSIQLNHFILRGFFVFLGFFPGFFLSLNTVDKIRNSKKFNFL